MSDVMTEYIAFDSYSNWAEFTKQNKNIFFRGNIVVLQLDYETICETKQERDIFFKMSILFTFTAITVI